MGAEEEEGEGGEEEEEGGMGTGGVGRWVVDIGWGLFDLIAWEVLGVDDLMFRGAETTAIGVAAPGCED